MLKSRKSTSPETHRPSFFEHSECPHWGASLVVWEGDGKRAYHFEDGKVRVFNENQHALLRRILRPALGCAEFLKLLHQQAEGPGSGSVPSARIPASFERLPLVKQCARFASLFPKGLRSLFGQVPSPEWANSAFG